jgi:hypothetical protein
VCGQGLNLIIFPLIFKRQPLNRNRYIYSLLLVITIATGLASRHFPGILPYLVQLYLGDTLWAFMVFLLFGFVFHTKNTLWIAIFALAFSYSIEISQLYHAPWIDSLRANSLGGLILGFGFLWSDMVCYIIGVGVGYTMEKMFFKR